MKLKKVIFLLIIILVSVRCTVSKRVYRKGYTVFWNEKKQSPKNLAVQKNNATENEISPGLKETFDTENINASVTKVISVKRTSYDLRNPKLSSDSCGDVITLANGDEIPAKVLEIGPNTIKYKPCDNLDGPIILIGNEKVFMIRYQNGTKELIKKGSEKPGDKIKTTYKDLKNSINSTDDKKTVYYLPAIIGFVCLCCFFLYFTIPAAIILGFISLRKFKKFPGKYKGKWMAQCAFWIPSCIIALIILGVLLGKITQNKP